MDNYIICKHFAIEFSVENLGYDDSRHWADNDLQSNSWDNDVL